MVFLLFQQNPDRVSSLLIWSITSSSVISTVNLALPKPYVENGSTAMKTAINEIHLMIEKALFSAKNLGNWLTFRKISYFPCLRFSSAEITDSNGKFSRFTSNSSGQSVPYTSAASVFVVQVTGNNDREEKVCSNCLGSWSIRCFPKCIRIQSLRNISGS